jgi:hypothetical protein
MAWYIRADVWQDLRVSDLWLELLEELGLEYDAKRTIRSSALYGAPRFFRRLALLF